MTTVFYTHPRCHDHVTPPGHPEQVARLAAIESALSAPQYDMLDRRDAPMATPDMVELCHPRAHYERIAAAEPKEGWAQLDGDTFLAPGSLEAAMRAIGGNLAAVDAVIGGEAQNAFVACRPPGHHAETETPMGFCLFSTIGIAARYAADTHGLSRIAVLDFDVHHGNGTQDVLWSEDRVLFVSSHQMPLYPGSGGRNEQGAHGQILNKPLESGSGGVKMRATWDRVIDTALRRYQPELILVSAGFDAHRADPLAGLNWSTDDFAWLARRICDLADETCAGRVVSSLEGGYDLDALGESVSAYIDVMMERGR
ncbi:histone deacetylase family protein [Aliiroseovarius crassostreae]|uniref:Histone deacetylase family protein n=1 Tax=Aliiroseovarius crassostreae TaxID=154981 RepID=A0A9Q9LXB9_9RHOB|nr:histone deacetylase family protein [Aliiroseovarius crassostreae]UWP95387.1 histone deacetylase family protein [Aliiroseovarius crassostreae]